MERAKASSSRALSGNRRQTAVEVVVQHQRRRRRAWASEVTRASRPYSTSSYLDRETMPTEGGRLVTGISDRRSGNPDRTSTLDIGGDKSVPYRASQLSLPGMARPASSPTSSGMERAHPGAL